LIRWFRKALQEFTLRLFAILALTTEFLFAELILHLATNLINKRYRFGGETTLFARVDVFESLLKIFTS
jgi:hypothetical protein